jgi:uncharacterized protein
VDDKFVARYGIWAVVTGASSGIGEEFARQLAARGMNLVLVARRRDRLEALGTALEKQHGVRSLIVEQSLTDEGAIEALTSTTAEMEIGLLVNNAGYGMKGAFLEMDLAEQRRMVRLNCEVPLALAHHYGQKMAARGKGGMVFVASTAAYQGLPGSSVYGATKGFDLLLGEGLWFELGEQGIDVISLCPGPTDTEGPKRTGVNPDKVPNMMPVEPVVRAALAKIGRKHAVVPGFTNKLAAFATRLVSRRFSTRTAGKLIKRVSE